MSLSAKRRILIDDQESIHQDYRKIMTPRETQAGGLADVEAELLGNLALASDCVEAELYEIDSAFQGAEALREGRPCCARRLFDRDNPQQLADVGRFLSNKRRGR